MDTDKIAQLMRGIVGGGPWPFVKWMFVVGLVMYLLFALIIVRQSMIMNETIEARHNEIVRIMAWLHLALVGFVLLVAIFVL